MGFATATPQSPKPRRSNGTGTLHVQIGRKPTTLANYRTILGLRLLPRFGEMPVDRVRPAQVEALAAQMIREGISAHTRANTLKLLSQVFNYSLRRRWCRENPCLG